MAADAGTLAPKLWGRLAAVSPAQRSRCWLWEESAGDRGNIYPGAQKEWFSQNSQWPGRPAVALDSPSISLSKYLAGEEVPSGFCTLRSAPVWVLAPVCVHLGGPAAHPKSPGDGPPLYQATPRASPSLLHKNQGSWKSSLPSLAAGPPSGLGALASQRGNGRKGRLLHHG